MKYLKGLYLVSLISLAAVLPIACGKGAVRSETKDVGYTTLASGETAPHKTFKKSTPPLTLEDIWNQLKPVNLAWNVPGRMQMGDTQNVTLTLTGKMSLGDLEKRLKRKKFGGDLTGAKNVVISDELTARMTGDGFTITPTTPAKQASVAEMTEWKWTVNPNQDGDQQKLHLELLASVKVDGVEKTAPVTTLDNTVEVFTTPGQKLGKLFGSPWFWILLVLVGVVVYYARSTQEKKKA